MKNNTITIDDEFKSLLVPLSPEAFAALEECIRKEGCRDKLVVWDTDGQQILIDGHNRHKICEKESIPFGVEKLSFGSRYDAIAWVITNQLARRNLTAEQIAYYRGMRYQNEKKREGRPIGKKLVQNGQVSTAERLAEELKASPTTIRRDASFAQAVETIAEKVSPEEKQEILAGKSLLSREEVVEVGKELEDLDAGSDDISAKAAEIVNKKKQPKKEKIKRREEEKRQKGEETPSPPKRVKGVYCDMHDNAFSRAVARLKTLGKAPKTKFLETIGFGEAREMFLGSLHERPSMSVLEDNGDMELVISQDGKDFTELFMQCLHKAHHDTKQYSKQSFDVVIIKKAIQELYDLCFTSGVTR